VLTVFEIKNQRQTANTHGKLASCPLTNNK